jgi:hypothetical protein
MKTEVYSWRVPAEFKAQLAEQARKERKSLSSLLLEFASDGLRGRNNGGADDDEEQAALRKRVMATVGTIRGGDPTRAERAGQLVREIIQRKHEKESRASLRRTNRNH